MKRIDASDYAPYVNTRLGTQVVRSVQLCQMTKTREDGYYFVHYEGYFAPDTWIFRIQSCYQYLLNVIEITSVLIMLQYSYTPLYRPTLYTINVDGIDDLAV